MSFVPVDAHTVALKQLWENNDIIPLQFSTSTSVNCLTCV